MGRWLLKTEPGAYSWDDLVNDRSTVWDGVSNALALRHLRAMKKGDGVLIYHTGSQKAVVGIAQVESDPRLDPGDPRLPLIKIKAIKKLDAPVTLAVIKADPVFAGFDLLRLSRLSVMPVPPSMWKRIETLGKSGRSIIRS